MSLIYGQYANPNLTASNSVQIGVSGPLRVEPDPYFLNATAREWLFTGAHSAYVTKLMDLLENVNGDDLLSQIVIPENIFPLDDQGNYGFAFYPVS